MVEPAAKKLCTGAVKRIAIEGNIGEPTSMEPIPIVQFTVHDIDSKGTLS